MITGHIFRPAHTISRRRTGEQGGPAIRPGMCIFGGTCDRPASDHISVEEYRRRLRAGAA